MRNSLILLCIFLFSSVAFAAHEYPEAAYQRAWCSANAGVLEYKNPDKTRIDCLTEDYAVEFDFATKWAESIGQALHYGLMTQKKPMAVLILESSEQYKYFERAKNIGDHYGITVDYVTKDILK